MKKIINGNELQEKMQESIHMLCDTVKTTLGPIGSNVIIDHSLFSPFITNDGATIAQNIESEDSIINTILEIAKEASLKTNTLVGDGTTTTLVLLESLFDACQNEIKKGKNPIILKKELQQSCEQVLSLLDKEKRKPTAKDLQTIATIASNEEEIGHFIYKVFQKVKRKSAIQIEEQESPLLKVSYLNGYCIDTTLASSYFLKEKNSLVLSNAYVLLFSTPYIEIEDISFLLNETYQNNIVILASDFPDTFINDFASLCLSKTIQGCLVKIDPYTIENQQIMQDLEQITSTTFLQESKNLSLASCGFCKQITISKNTTTFSFSKTKELQNYIKKMQKQKELVKDEYEKTLLEKRIAMFTNGLAILLVGAPTKTECHEKRMRVEDALCALESAKEGVLIGCGISLLKVAECLHVHTQADRIVKNALLKPFDQILENAGLDPKPILIELQKKEYQTGFNVITNQLETPPNFSVLDSYQVLRNAFLNACSITNMLISTTSLVINEQAHTLEKINEYTDL